MADSDEMALLLHLLQEKTKEISPLLQEIIQKIPFDVSISILAEIMAERGQEHEYYLSALKERIEAVLALEENKKKIQSAQADIMNQIIQDLRNQISTQGIQESEANIRKIYRT